MLILMNTWTVLKDLMKKNSLIKYVKHGATNDDDEKLDGHISDEDYFTCNKIWNKFNMKNMNDYNDHYLKKNVLL